MALDPKQEIPVRGVAVERLGGRTKIDVGAWVGYAAAGGFEALSRLPRIEATIKAQSAAIEALAKGVGVDPERIEATVRDAVAEALRGLEITLTTED